MYSWSFDKLHFFPFFLSRFPSRSSKHRRRCRPKNVTQLLLRLVAKTERFLDKLMFTEEISLNVDFMTYKTTMRRDTACDGEVKNLGQFSAVWWVESAPWNVLLFPFVVITTTARLHGVNNQFFNIYLPRVWRCLRASSAKVKVICLLG